MNQFKFYFSTLVILLIAFNFNAVAQDESHVSSKLLFPVDKLAKQNSYEVLIEIDIAEHWHINSNQPLEDFLIGTEISFDQTEGVTFGKIQFPKPEMKKFAFSEGEMSVYEGTVYAFTTITISPDINTDQLNMSGYVYYQACDDQTCLPPTEIILNESIEIVENNSEVIKTNEQIFNKVSPTFQNQ